MNFNIPSNNLPLLRAVSQGLQMFSLQGIVVSIVFVVQECQTGKVLLLITDLWTHGKSTVH